MKALEIVQREYHNNDISMTELIIDMLKTQEIKLSNDEIYELLCWAGEEDYMSPEEIIKEVHRND
jgi:hypothetical protein